MYKISSSNIQEYTEIIPSKNLRIAERIRLRYIETRKITRPDYDAYLLDVESAKILSLAAETCRKHKINPEYYVAHAFEFYGMPQMPLRFLGAEKYMLYIRSGGFNDEIKARIVRDFKMMVHLFQRYHIQLSVPVKDVLSDQALYFDDLFRYSFACHYNESMLAALYKDSAMRLVAETPLLLDIYSPFIPKDVINEFHAVANI